MKAQALTAYGEFPAWFKILVPDERVQELVGDALVENYEAGWHDAELAASAGVRPRRQPRRQHVSLSSLLNL